MKIKHIIKKEMFTTDKEKILSFLYDSVLRYEFINDDVLLKWLQSEVELNILNINKFWDNHKNIIVSYVLYGINDNNTNKNKDILSLVNNELLQLDESFCITQWDLYKCTFRYKFLMIRLFLEKFRREVLRYNISDIFIKVISINSLYCVNDQDIKDLNLELDPLYTSNDILLYNYKGVDDYLYNIFINNDIYSWKKDPSNLKIIIKKGSSFIIFYIRNTINFDIENYLTKRNICEFKIFHRYLTDIIDDYDEYFLDKYYEGIKEELNYIKKDFESVIDLINNNLNEDQKINYFEVEEDYYGFHFLIGAINNEDLMKLFVYKIFNKFRCSSRDADGDKSIYLYEFEDFPDIEVEITDIEFAENPMIVLFNKNDDTSKFLYN